MSSVAAALAARAPIRGRNSDAIRARRDEQKAAPVIPPQPSSTGTVEIDGILDEERVAID